MNSKALAKLAPRDRRAILLGAIAALFAAANALVVRPFTSAYGEARDGVAQERELLSRELSLLASRRRITVELAETRSQLLAADSRLFRGGDVIEATSALSSYVGSAARQSGLVVQQVESHDATDAAAGLHELTIDVRAEGNLAGILHTLSSLESGPRLVRVTQVSIERSLATVQSGTFGSLVFSATVRGYGRITE